MESFYGWYHTPKEEPQNSLFCATHEPIDNGTKVTECCKCRKRLVFEFPEWKEKDV